MKRKPAFILLVTVAAFTLLLSGCQRFLPDDQSGTTDGSAVTTTKPVIATPGVSAAQNTGNLIDAAAAAVQLIKNKDFAALSQYVHPQKGVRFSPHSFVNMPVDIVYSANDIKNAFTAEQTQKSWGTYDGSGLPILLTFTQYYDRFVYDADYADAPMIGNNTVIGKGNMQNNISEAYPEGKFIEYHFNGQDPQYNGMDWKSLRLIFEKSDGRWYLVGIQHDQWTI